MKQVLIIAYYFPPMGGSGVQRPLKFAKYLPEFGWKPIILAPDPGLYHKFDEDLMSEVQELNLPVTRVEGKTPFQFGKRKISYSPWLQKILGTVTHWFYFPDNKKGWIDPAVSKAEEIVQENHIDAIFVTAPPYSNLIIGARLKEHFKLPLIMDLRDDWLESHHIRYPTRWHRNKMEKIEKNTLGDADVITVVNDAYKKAIQHRFNGTLSVTTIANGYDPMDFHGIQPAGNKNRFSVLYSGLFYGSQQPDSYLKGVKIALETEPKLRKDLELQFQGGLSKRHWKLINRLKLTKMVVDFDYIAHKQAVSNLMNADLLVLILGRQKKADTVTPGKMFEYFGTGKPILGLIPDGITKDMLNLYKAAAIADIDQPKAISEQLLNMYQMWKNNEQPAPNRDYAKQFDRIRLTEKLSKVLDGTLESKLYFND